MRQLKTLNVSSLKPSLRGIEVSDKVIRDSGWIANDPFFVAGSVCKLSTK